MKILPIRTRLCREHDELISFIEEHIPEFEERDVLVITSKIVSLTHGLLIPITKKKKTLAQISPHIIHTPWALLTFHDGEWRINGGADESNIKNKVALLPENPFDIAEDVHTYFRKKWSLKAFAVIITDSRSTPLRAGTVGRAIGFAGFEPLKSYIGKEDLHGRKSRVTVSNHADALAAAAVLTMGEGKESTPLAVIHDAPVQFVQKKISIKKRQLSLLPDVDIFSYVYQKSADSKKHKRKGQE